MDEEDTFLVEDTQLSIYEKKRKKSQRSWEEQPIVSSDQICYSSQDTEDFVTRRKKHKKKKTSSETSDASWVIPETPLIDESEINDFVPKKKKKKKKHRHKHGSETSVGAHQRPQKTSKLSPKKASENGGDTAVGDEFCSASTPQKPIKLSQKKTSENGGDGAVGDEFRNGSTLKKSSKRRKASENGGDTAVGDEFCSASTPQKPSKLSPKKTLENAGDGAVGDEFRNGSTPKKSSKRSKALENGGDTAVGDEFCSASIPQKPSKLSQKRTSESGGDCAVGDEFRNGSTLKKSSKRSKASENGGDTAIGDEFCSASTPQKPSKLSLKKTLENAGDSALGDEFWSGSIPKKSSKRPKALENGGDTAVGDEFCSASTPQKPSKLSLKKTLENAGDSAVGDEFWSGSIPKKSSKRPKALENGGDTAVGDEFCSTSTPQKPSKLSPKKTSENGGDGAVGDEFRSVSTPRKSSKLPRKEDLENGSGVESNRSSHKKKKRKRRMSCVPDGPTEEKAEVTRSPREGQVDLDETIDTQMDLFASSPLSFSEGPQVGLLPRDDQEGSHSPTAENSDATQVDLEMEGTSAGDHGQEQPPSPSQSLTSEVDKKSVQSRMGRKLRSSRKQAPSETYSEEEEEEDVYALSKEQLENDRKELEEYIPRAKTMSDSAIRQLAILDLSRFRELKKKGMAVRFGVFSQAENDLLTENVEAFLEESGIETPEKLLFAHRFPEEQAEIKRRKCQYQFCERIARGIARPWRLVYYRARKMFDPQNYNGRYTKKEEKKLFKYHAMYGNNWKKISELMNRSSHSIALKYSLMVEDFNLGPWTKEEISRLLKAIQDILKTRVKGLENRDGKETLTLLRESLYKNIRWVKVAAQVETRGWRQCKTKWTSILTKRMMGKSHSPGLSNLQFKIDLIERLYDLNVADTNEIDWESIAEAIGNFPPDYLKSRYYQLKSIYVPFGYQKTFPEIIDYLFEEMLPVFKETFQKLSQSQGHPPEETKCKKSFRFNDIFRDMLEDELLNALDDDDSDSEIGEESQAE